MPNNDLPGTLDTDHGPKTSPQSTTAPGEQSSQEAMSALDLRGYELSERLGGGGMGDVYRAADPALGRDLAVKVMKADLLGFTTAERRFLREARVTGSLQHPGIVPIHNLGRLADGRLHYTMRLVRGRTFADILREEAGQPQRLPALLTIFEKVCQAVAYAHSKQVIHRDLKPSNVMVGRFGEVQVMDWGLAKLLTAEDEPTPPEGAAEGGGTRIYTESEETPLEQTRMGREMGTPAYMPPEQALGEWDTVDERADVFALGAILCEILTGRSPYRSGDQEDVLRKAKRGDCREALVRLENCGADAALVELCRECLAAERLQRPRHAGMVAERLASYQAEVGERLRQAELQRARAEVEALEERKRRRLIAALALFVLVLAASGVAVWRQGQQRRAAADDAVKDALSEARLLHQQAQADPLTVLAYDRAMAAARKAEDIAHAGGASSAMQEQASELLAELQQEAEAAAKDRQLLAALLEVRGPREGPKYNRDAKGTMMALAEPSVEEQFASAFRAWGLDVDAASAAEAAARMKGRPAAVVTQVIASLDEWASQRRLDRKPEKQWRNLAQLAAALDDDPDSQRAELRAILARGRLPIERALGALSAALRPVPVPVEVPLGEDRGRLQRLAEKMAPASEPVLGLLTLTRALRLAGEEATAERLLRAALQARPREVVLYHTLGQLLTEQKPPRWTEAVECYTAARALRPDLGTILAEALRISGRGEEGLALLVQMAREKPNNPFLLSQQGLALVLRAKFGEAETAFRQALAIQPDDVDTHFNLGIACFYLGKYGETEAIFRKAIALKPNDGKLYAVLGINLEKAGRYTEANEAYRKAITLNPHDDVAHAVLGYTLARQGKNLEAVAAFLKVNANNPDVAWVVASISQMLRGNALRSLRNLDGAIACYKKALDAIPGNMDAPAILCNAMVQRSLGGALHEKRDLEGAIACYRKVLELNPKFEALDVSLDFAEVHNDLGNVLYDKRDLDGALACYQKALALNPHYLHAHSNIGNVLRDKGDGEGAIACYKKALAIDPRHAYAHNGLGNVLLDKRDLDGAIACYKKTLALDPKFVFALNNLGLALRAKGDEEGAIAYFKKALALDNKCAVAHNNLADALYGRARLREAAAEYRKAIALGVTTSLPQLQRCQRLLALGERLPAVLRGESAPVDATQRIDLAYLTYSMKRYVQSARFFADAFAAEPKLADDLQQQHRYNAACSAALAAAAQGQDARLLPDKVAVMFRRWALNWLRDDLTAYAAVIGQDKNALKQNLPRLLAHWKHDLDLAAVRDPQALGRLPDDERTAWQALWNEVDQLANRAVEKKP